MAQINDYALLARRFCPLLVYLALVGCDKTVAWQEELQLSTGETIMIDREVVLKPGSGLPPAVGPYVNGYRIRFRYPPQTGPVIEWEFIRRPGYEYEYPLVLDLDQDKTWFIFTLRTVGAACIRYVKYQFQKGTWVEKPLSEDIISVHQTNLSVKTGAKDNRDGNIVTLMEKKHQLGANPYPPPYMKQIGPQQITPTSNVLRCVWDPVNKTFNATRIN